MTRAMAILHQLDASGGDIRSHGLAKGHNESFQHENLKIHTSIPGESIESAAARRQGA